MGSSIDPPGRPAKLLPFNTENLAMIFEKWLVIIFMTAFLNVSSKVSGQVFVILYCQSMGLEIG